MAIGGLEGQPIFSQPPSPLVAQTQKSGPALRPNSNGIEKSKEPAQSNLSSPVQDQVSLSREAQTLSATSHSQNEKNNTFQGSTSPFDK